MWKFSVLSKIVPDIFDIINYYAVYCSLNYLIYTGDKQHKYFAMATIFRQVIYLSHILNIFSVCTSIKNIYTDSL